jgi:hypothetical protein
MYDRHFVNAHWQRPFPPVTSMAIEVTGGNSSAYSSAYCVRSRLASSGSACPAM